MIKSLFIQCALIITLLTISPGTSVAEDLSNLMKSFSSVKHRQASFTEIKSAFYLEKPILSSGTLIFDAPDKLVKKTISPKRVTQTISGNELEITRANGQVQRLSLFDHPVLLTILVSLRSILSGDIDFINSHYKQSLRNSAAGWELKLEPKNKEVRKHIRLIEVSGKKNQISKFRIIESNGDYTETRIHEYR